ncbi:transcription factor bHLH112 [Elaeis guineensis]|uniref:Transcription factor bHLH112 n=1 Tax=Elaeis guineensis var. tenera TaxID=51953 RepID=A0A6I9S1P0_ELAGV|nr:transcription factor bHLH112 [Elaeis guineensis]
MAEEFQTGIYNSGRWWSTTRTGVFDGPVMSTSVSCSTEFNWATAADVVEAKSRSSDESLGSVSNSSITFQDTHRPPASDQFAADPIVDSTLQVSDFGLSSPSVNWNQPFLTTGGRAENNLPAFLQEDMSSGSYLRHEPVIESNQIHMNVESSSSLNLLEDLKQGLMHDQHHLISSGNSRPLFPAPFGLPPTLLQCLFEPETKHPESFNNQRMDSLMRYHGVLNESLQSEAAKLPEFDKALPVKHQLHFSNNTPFWNPSAIATTETSLGLYSSTTTDLAPHAFEGKTSCSNVLVQSNSEGAGESRSNATKKSSNEPAFKKPRIETPSPLPTFKVRKEKLGDRVTALQQLVSPFGKTDTASVLHEAIEYIKYLHEQVGVLSAPYLKNGHQVQHLQNSDEINGGEGPQLDLRSRGLCLVPISSTFAVVSETPVDFWTPTFGGTYR